MVRSRKWRRGDKETNFLMELGGRSLALLLFERSTVRDRDYAIHGRDARATSEDNLGTGLDENVYTTIYHGLVAG